MPADSLPKRAASAPGSGPCATPRPRCRWTHKKTVLRRRVQAPAVTIKGGKIAELERTAIEPESEDVFLLYGARFRVGAAAAAGALIVASAFASGCGSSGDDNNGNGGGLGSGASGPVFGGTGSTGSAA